MPLVDLSHPLAHGQQTFPSDPKLSIVPHGTTATLRYNITQVSMSTHQGTHLDAMYHFVDDGKTLDQMPLDWFYGPATVLRIPKAPREEITADDFRPHERRGSRALEINLTEPSTLLLLEDLGQGTFRLSAQVLEGFLDLFAGRRRNRVALLVDLRLLILVSATTAAVRHLRHQFLRHLVGSRARLLNLILLLVGQLEFVLNGLIGDKTENVATAPTSRSATKTARSAAKTAWPTPEPAGTATEAATTTPAATLTLALSALALVALTLVGSWRLSKSLAEPFSSTNSLGVNVDHERKDGDGGEGAAEHDRNSGHGARLLNREPGF